MRLQRGMGNKLLILACVILTGLVGGCGKKTKPLPPDTVLPAPISDLTYRLDEKGVTLSWSLPTRTVTDASLPYRIDGYELLRAVVPTKDFCEGCPIPFGAPIYIEGDKETRGKVYYQETLLRPQHRYVYKVRTRAGWFVSSDDSNIISLTWDVPLDAPQNLQTLPGDRQGTVSWEPPLALLDGSPVTAPLHYELFRTKGDGDFKMIAGSLQETEYIDRKVQNDIPYSYMVRAFRFVDGTAASGKASEVQRAVPIDRVAPAPPTHVALFKSEAGLRILWESEAERDLAGFRVYRRAEEMDAAVLVGEVTSGSPGFVDSSPPQQGLWYYSVSSFDRVRPPNESRRTKEALFDPQENE